MSKLVKRKAIAVIGEGPTEQEYFRYLCNKERYRIKVKPDLPSHSDYKSIFEKAKKLLKQEFDLVFCLIDLDKIIEERSMQKFLRIKSV